MSPYDEYNQKRSRYISIYIIPISIFTDIENKLVVTRKEREVGGAI